jgi:hypothetical protein
LAHIGACDIAPNALDGSTNIARAQKSQCRRTAVSDIDPDSKNRGKNCQSTIALIEPIGQEQFGAEVHASCVISR